MADRAVYLYRLVVTLPEGSDAEGWEPREWAAWCDDRGWESYDREEGETTFEWARFLRRKHFLSGGAAERRATMLRAFGATVKVERSNPATWGAVPQPALPVTREGALALALDWAEGRRSWTNLGSPHPDTRYTPDVIAVMDAQEVVKWSALAVALDGEKPQ